MELGLSPDLQVLATLLLTMSWLLAVSTWLDSASSGRWLSALLLLRSPHTSKLGVPTLATP